MFTFTASNLFGQILFGSIGMGAFIYGKKAELLRPILIGIVLMAYPYFVPATWMLYTIGVLLTAALFVFRE
jgi:hypothetical protein